MAQKKTVDVAVRSRRPAAQASQPKPAARPEPAPTAKHKLVRDSFTIPKDEYLVLTALKERAVQLKRPVKKSELLRAGIVALQGMSDRTFLAVLAKVPSLKTGRPRDDPAAAPAP